MAPWPGMAVSKSRARDASLHEQAVFRQRPADVLRPNAIRRLALGHARPDQISHAGTNRFHLIAKSDDVVAVHDCAVAGNGGVEIECEDVVHRRDPTLAAATIAVVDERSGSME